jgi:hypothetical protein
MTTVSSFVVGRLIAAVAWSGNISPTKPGSFLSIGSEDGRRYNLAVAANRYFKGLIDEVSIYNRALSAEEVSAIFTAADKGKMQVQPGNHSHADNYQPWY